MMIKQRSIALTAHGFEILTILIRNPEKVYSREFYMKWFRKDLKGDNMRDVIKKKHNNNYIKSYIV